jgi:hypothetical protein
MTTSNAYACVHCGKHTGLFLSSCRECEQSTVIPVSESQYLGSLELLGRVWSGEAVPTFGGRSPLVAYLWKLTPPAPRCLFERCNNPPLPHGICQRCQNRVDASKITGNHGVRPDSVPSWAGDDVGLYGGAA